MFSISHLFALTLNEKYTVSLSNSSIWQIDRTLPGATILGQSGPGAMAMNGYSALPKALALLKTHRQSI